MPTQPVIPRPISEMCSPISIMEVSCHPATIPVSLVCFQLEHMLSYSVAGLCTFYLIFHCPWNFLIAYPLTSFLVIELSQNWMFWKMWPCTTKFIILLEAYFYLFFFLKKKHWLSCFVLHSFSTHPIPQWAWLLCLLLNFFLYQQFQGLSPLGYQKVSFMSQHFSLSLN